MAISMEETKINNGKEELKCNVCSRTFDRRSRLVAHYKTHTGERPYSCPFCSKSFASKGNCNTHVRVHTRERPYVCQHCNKRFSQHGQMVIHVRRHTGEKPYVCVHCQKGFTCSKVLKIHIRTHTGEKPYVCDYCNKGFAAYANLVVHRRIHTRERPYSCKLCGRAFEHSGNLVRHERGHHVDGGIRCIPCGRLFQEISKLSEHVTSCHPHDKTKEDMEVAADRTTASMAVSQSSPDKIMTPKITVKDMARSNTFGIPAVDTNALAAVAATFTKEDYRHESPDSGCAAVSDEDDTHKDLDFKVKSAAIIQYGASRIEAIQRARPLLPVTMSNFKMFSDVHAALNSSNIRMPPKKSFSATNDRIGWTLHDNEVSRSLTLPMSSQSNPISETVSSNPDPTSRSDASENNSDDRSALSKCSQPLHPFKYLEVHRQTEKSSPEISRFVPSTTPTKYNSVAPSNPLNLSRDTIDYPSNQIKSLEGCDSQLRMKPSNPSEIRPAPDDFVDNYVHKKTKYPRTDHTLTSVPSVMDRTPLTDQTPSPDNNSNHDAGITMKRSCFPDTTMIHKSGIPALRNIFHLKDSVPEVMNLSSGQLNDKRVSASLHSPTSLSNIRENIRKSVLTILPNDEDRRAFKRNVETALLSLLGNTAITQLGYPEKNVEQVLVTVLDQVGMEPCADVRVDEEERLRLNMRKLLEYGFPEQSAWLSLGWSQQSIEAITDRIASWVHRSKWKETHGGATEAEDFRKWLPLSTQPPTEGTQPITLPPPSSSSPISLSPSAPFDVNNNLSNRGDHHHQQQVQLSPQYHYLQQQQMHQQQQLSPSHQQEQLQRFPPFQQQQLPQQQQQHSPVHHQQQQRLSPLQHQQELQNQRFSPSQQQQQQQRVMLAADLMVSVAPPSSSCCMSPVRQCAVQFSANTREGGYGSPTAGGLRPVYYTNTSNDDYNDDNNNASNKVIKQEDIRRSSFEKFQENEIFVK